LDATERSIESLLVVGREAELRRLDDFVRDFASGSTLVLIGEAGIGKTTLWEAALEAARARGVRVLAARSPVGGEAQLEFSGLIDLSEGIDEAELASVPAVQCRALEAVLLRAEPSPEPAAKGVIARAFLGVVRGMADRGPVVIAIDDLQWLDPASGEVLSFIARRVGGARVGFLCTRRPGRAGTLETSLARRGLVRLGVGPLSLGAVRRLLFERLGLTLSRQRLRRILDATDGNPLFALEVGRSLVERGERALDEGALLPESVEEMLGERVLRLSAAVRGVLLAVALSEGARVEQLVTVVGERALDEAVDAGVVSFDGARVHVSHPLLAAAAEKRSRAGDRRAMHLALSEVARDEPARALHLAFATSVPQAGLASRLAAASGVARSRGARRQAAVLASEALRLTPSGAAERAERVLELAACLDETGELRRMTVLLEEELASLPVGPLRARAWLLLSEGERVRSRYDQDAYLERALAVCGEDHNLRGHLRAKQAGNAAAAGVSNLGQAEGWALDGVDSATEPAVVRYALWALAWPRALAGQPLEELCEQSGVAADPSGYISASAERVAAYRLVWRGELDRARQSLDSLLALADERGDLTSYAMVRMHTVELELRAGNFDAAATLLGEWAESSDYETQFRPQYPRCRAVLLAGRGALDEATKCANDTIVLAQQAGSRWDELEARRALGIAALIEPAAEKARIELEPVWEHCEREGVLDPGAFPVAGELVEALVELERFDDARLVIDRLHERAAAQEHPWARATTKRCNAILGLATGGSAESDAALLREASVEFERLGLSFDAARCLLALGRAQRRLKRWRGARETLEQAIAGFLALGADGWTQRARSELERVGGRRRGDGGLTASERRVVELAAEGRSNKEIAAALYVTVNTVETHLARAYAKLGVRSRAQLASRLAAGA
jgi:DNA-binding CsgD family transcriptional regulator